MKRDIVSNPAINPAHDAGIFGFTNSYPQGLNSIENENNITKAKTHVVPHDLPTLSFGQSSMNHSWNWYHFTEKAFNGG